MSAFIFATVLNMKADGVTSIGFQTREPNCMCKFYEISSSGRLTRQQGKGGLKDTRLTKKIQGAKIAGFTL